MKSCVVVTAPISFYPFLVSVVLDGRSSPSSALLSTPLTSIVLLVYIYRQREEHCRICFNCHIMSDSGFSTTEYIRMVLLLCHQLVYFSSSLVLEVH